MKLLELKLRNFKGIREFSIRPDGDDLAIYGDNATGKTTLADAFMWVLFGKDSQNRADFEIKTLDKTGQVKHGLSHEVEAVLELVDGRQVTLTRCYEEQWTKRRGSATKEFTGHTTGYHIDGVPVKKSEYDAFISEIADEQLFRLLTDPTYFHQQMHWQDRRRLLLEVCGDVTDAEVIASNQALADLPVILGKRSLEDHRKVVQARRSEINRELERIPTRIDEVQRGLPDVPEDVSKDAVEAELKAIREQRSELEAERVRIQSGGQVAELQKHLSEVQAELTTARQRARESAEQGVRAERTRLAELEDQIAGKQRLVRRLEAEHQEAASEADQIRTRMDAKRAEWHRINEEAFQLDQDEQCPACGQPLPEEHLREAREKALAEVNERKSKRLEEISAEGKRLKERLEQNEAAAKEREAAIRTAARELGDLETQAKELRQVIEDAQRQAPDPAEDPEVQRLQSEADLIAGEIAALRESNAEALQQVAADIAAIDEQIGSLERQLSQFAVRERGLARIAELEAEERKLAAEFEELERQLHLTDLFIRSKVKLLEQRINARFQLARFQLFRLLVNGGVEECCEVTYQGVPYTSLNHGARLNVGIDVINTLAEHYGFAPPVWVDNAESVTSILPARGQMIKLVVSAGDKELRVESDSARVKEAV